ncbi:hypothetical protein SAMN04489712_116136 [Thermomonospora echinospora]|uniref:DUF4157 domain-containing protein n=1 Tax=Thermomonospora echinospora TaxID=1992 RepID=A0A1H6DG24_9ACTN|nr:hypothetical protein [Thermomonospora echinospora]SEG84062.1 hypothetical protein SAMN04489712_116136 [Thermomonospora echinospora]
MERRHRLRQIVNVANLSTPLGVLLARTGTGGLRRGPQGLLIGTGYRLPLPVAPAFTVGNVVLVRGDGSVLERRPRLLAHEARHATQYACCLGPLMIVLYLAGAGLSMALCGDHASYNPFERLAGLEDGGYTKRPLRFTRH